MITGQTAKLTGLFSKTMLK
jgi:arginase